MDLREAMTLNVSAPSHEQKLRHWALFACQPLKHSEHPADVQPIFEGVSSWARASYICHRIQFGLGQPGGVWALEALDLGTPYQPQTVPPRSRGLGATPRNKGRPKPSV